MFMFVKAQTHSMRVNSSPLQVFSPTNFSGIINIVTKFPDQRGRKMRSRNVVPLLVIGFYMVDAFDTIFCDYDYIIKHSQSINSVKNTQQKRNFVPISLFLHKETVQIIPPL